MYTDRDAPRIKSGETTTSYQFLFWATVDAARFPVTLGFLLNEIKSEGQEDCGLRQEDRKSEPNCRGEKSSGIIRLLFARYDKISIDGEIADTQQRFRAKIFAGISRAPSLTRCLHEWKLKNYLDGSLGARIFFTF
jgi:hypothetical protein